jgi:hypothetical protein
MSFFLDKNDGEVRIELDFYLPEWLRMLLWPNHRIDPQDQELHLSVYEQYRRDTMELAMMEMLRYSFTDPLNGCTNLALPTDQE